MSKVDDATRERIVRVCTQKQADVLLAILAGSSRREIARTTGLRRPTIREHYEAALDRIRKSDTSGPAIADAMEQLAASFESLGRTTRGERP